MGGSQQRRPGTGGTAAAAQCKCLPCEQRRQEASSSALRCALLRPGDGSDVIGSGPTNTHRHRHKHTSPRLPFSSDYMKALGKNL